MVVLNRQPELFKTYTLGDRLMIAPVSHYRMLEDIPAYAYSIPIENKVLAEWSFPYHIRSEQFAHDIAEEVEQYEQQPCTD